MKEEMKNPKYEMIKKYLQLRDADNRIFSKEIVDIVGHTTMSTNHWKSKCPFCKNRLEGFTFIPERQVFYCFDCHKGGDLIAFIAVTKNINQEQAMDYLIEKYEIKKEVNEERTIEQKKITTPRKS